MKLSTLARICRSLPILLGLLLAFMISPTARGETLKTERARTLLGSLSALSTADRLKGMEDLNLLGVRVSEAQPTLERLLAGTRNQAMADSIVETILNTTTDAHFLAVALLDWDALPLSQSLKVKLHSQFRSSQSVADLLYSCAGPDVRGSFLPLEKLTPDSYDEVEARSHCVYALAELDPEVSVGHLQSLLRDRASLLGSDIARCFRKMLARALLEKNSVWAEKFSQIIFTELDRETPESAAASVLRMNFAMAISVPKNPRVATELQRFIDRERDPDVLKFLKQAIRLVQQETYD